MKEFLKNFPFDKVSIFVATVVSFTHNVLLDRNVACTCDYQIRDCIIYMALPSFIIFVLILWTDKTFQRVGRYTCGMCSRPCCSAKCCGFCGVLLCHIVKAALVGLLWVVSVLIDGDWWVCCKNDVYDYDLACKDKTKITTEEQKHINDLKNRSRVSVSLFYIFHISML